MKKIRTWYLGTSAVRAGIVLGMLLATVNGTYAFDIGTSNDDVKIRWDNSIRYNLGVRAKDCDPNICGNGSGLVGDPVNYQSDAKFRKAGDVVTNRLDILSEFDLIYKQNTGVRVSAAAWFDEAYKNNKIVGDPGLDRAVGGIPGNGAGPSGGNYVGYTKRWNRGLSGEILDAFLFTKVDLGEVPVNLKLGQHNVYWGESLFSAMGGVAYGQGPMDFRKGLANPGVQAKEIFLPLDQFSWTAQLTDEFSLAGQYFLDWKTLRIPDGGTYWGVADGASFGGTGTVFGLPLFLNSPHQEPARKYGDWGLAAKWRPQWLDGTAGFYYREFTIKTPQFIAVPGGFGIDYSSNDGKRDKLYGFSLTKQIWGIAFGMDLTYRKDAVLSAIPFGVFVAPGTPASAWVPRGDIYTGVLNAVAYIGKTPVFDSAVLLAEFNYANLDKVTRNPKNFNGAGYGCGNPRPKLNACPSKDAWGMNILFEPRYFQVLDGVDMTVPIYFGQGIHGNSPVIFGDNDGMGSYSVGVTADVFAKYNFALKYNGQISKHSNDQAGAFSNNNAVLGKFWDRNWVSLTFKMSF